MLGFEGWATIVTLFLVCFGLFRRARKPLRPPIAGRPRSRVRERRITQPRQPFLPSLAFTIGALTAWAARQVQECKENWDRAWREHGPVQANYRNAAMSSRSTGLSVATSASPSMDGVASAGTERNGTRNAEREAEQAADEPIRDAQARVLRAWSEGKMLDKGDLAALMGVRKDRAIKMIESATKEEKKVEL